MPKAYISKKHQKIIENQKSELSDSELSSKRKKQTINKPKKKNNNKLNKPSTHLKAIVSNEDGFRLFAQHLMHEFAIENLLFYIETNQWLRSLIEKSEINNWLIEYDEKSSGIDIKFASNAPKSRIVQFCKLSLSDKIAAEKIYESSDNLVGNETPHDFGRAISLETRENVINDPWMQSVKFFKKYIIFGSYFAINISGGDRAYLYKLFGFEDKINKSEQELCENLKINCNNSINQLFHIFDTSRLAVFKSLLLFL